MRPAMPLPPRWQPGRYYTAPGLSVTGAQPTQDRLRVFPLDMHRTTRFDRIASEVTVATESATLRWVVYADAGESFPGALVLDTGAVGDASTTGVKSATIDLTLAARRYWIGCISQGANATLRTFSGTSAFGAGNSEQGIASGFSIGFYTSSITDDAPATFPTSGAPSAQAPSAWLRVAT